MRDQDTSGWSTAEHALHDLGEHLSRIGKKNGDSFRVQVLLERGNTFRIEVIEAGEGHLLSAENAATIVEAANQLRAGLKGHCAAWAYKYVE